MSKVLGMYTSAGDYEKGASKVPKEVQSKYTAAKTKVALHFKDNPSKKIDPSGGDDKSYVNVVDNSGKYSVEMFTKKGKVSTAALN